MLVAEIDAEIGADLGAEFGSDFLHVRVGETLLPVVDDSEGVPTEWRVREDIERLEGDRRDGSGDQAPAQVDCEARTKSSRASDRASLTR